MMLFAVHAVIDRKAKDITSTKANILLFFHMFTIQAVERPKNQWSYLELNINFEYLIFKICPFFF